MWWITCTECLKLCWHSAVCGLSDLVSLFKNRESFQWEAPGWINRSFLCGMLGSRDRIKSFFTAERDGLSSGSREKNLPSTDTEAQQIKMPLLFSRPSGLHFGISPLTFERIWGNTKVHKLLAVVTLYHYQLLLYHYQLLTPYPYHPWSMNHQLSSIDLCLLDIVH